MIDGRDINWVTDESGKRWLIDADGKYARVNGERVPGPAAKVNEESSFLVYDDSQGHCAFCGRLTCRSTCFK